MIDVGGTEAGSRDGSPGITEDSFFSVWCGAITPVGCGVGGTETWTDGKEGFVLEKADERGVWQDQWHLDFLVPSGSSNWGIPYGSWSLRSCVMNAVTSEAPQTGYISLFEERKRLGYSFNSNHWKNWIWSIPSGSCGMGTTTESGKP